jgi:hypothetical protein
LISYLDRVLVPIGGVKDFPFAFIELSDEEVLSLQSVEILIADPKVYRRLSISLPNLKWMQLLWAGEFLMPFGVCVYFELVTIITVS